MNSDIQNVVLSYGLVLFQQTGLWTDITRNNLRNVVGESHIFYKYMDIRGLFSVANLTFPDRESEIWYGEYFITYDCLTIWSDDIHKYKEASVY